ncbi:MAG: zf-HC2 domain-containing protein [Bacillota bacterium]
MKETHLSSTCPTEETLFAFLDGEVDAGTQVEILRHLSDCEACRRILADTAALFAGVAGTLKASPPAELPTGAELDVAMDHIVDALKASGDVRQRRRLDARDLARRLGRGVARGTRVAATSLIGGARVAYSGVVAISRVAGGASRAAAWVAGRSPWRLAW